MRALSKIFQPVGPQQFRKRLWKAGGLICMFVLTCCVGNNFLAPERRFNIHMFGYDFLAFYYGGSSVHTGHSEQLFDLGQTHAFEKRVGKEAKLELGPSSFGPWWNPPFAAWLFAPLATMPFEQALHTWWLFSFACLAVAIWLMMRMLRGGWGTKLLVPLFVISSMPCIEVFSHGQNTYLSLMLLTIVVTLWRADQSFVAGLVCGLLFYKPQLGALVAAILCLQQGRRALLGVTLTGFALLTINLLTMPGTLHSFFRVMPGNMRWMQEDLNYIWQRHVTLKAFWRLLIMGQHKGPDWLSVKVMWGFSDLLLGGALAVLVFKVRAVSRNLSDSAQSKDRLIAASIAAMPLLMPFYFDYDLLLVSVAAVLYAASRQGEWIDGVRPLWEDRWLLRLWVTLFVTLEVTVVWMDRARVHPVTLLMCGIAALLIRRGLRPAQIPVDTSVDDPDDLANLMPAIAA